MTGLGSFWRLSWTVTRMPEARAASRSGRVVADAMGAVGGTLKVGLSRSRASSPVAGLEFPRQPQARRLDHRGQPEHDLCGEFARLVDGLVAALAPTAASSFRAANDPFVEGLSN
jgi:hypothetical protein